MRRITVTVEARPMPSETASSPTLDAALALLDFPDVDELTDAQRRGLTCVHDAFGFDPTTVVRFGQRTSERGDWFPSAHPRCVAHMALASLRSHAACCEQCVDDASQCETAAALVLLVEEYSR
ncbi:hypothetical protein AB0M11_26710 [Streptomyces sp. NPDC051987]|uniref:hypothetical protein n=1 Tax=Streptomyces sp. NPDC051987 TaxID=3155808 RepID=UPI003435EDB6